MCNEILYIYRKEHINEHKKKTNLSTFVPARRWVSACSTLTPWSCALAKAPARTRSCGVPMKCCIVPGVLSGPSAAVQKTTSAVKAAPSGVPSSGCGMAIERANSGWSTRPWISSRTSDGARRNDGMVRRDDQRASAASWDGPARAAAPSPGSRSNCAAPFRESREFRKLAPQQGRENGRDDLGQERPRRGDQRGAALRGDGRVERRELLHQKFGQRRRPCDEPLMTPPCRGREKK